MQNIPLEKLRVAEFRTLTVDATVSLFHAHDLLSFGWSQLTSIEWARLLSYLARLENARASNKHGVLIRYIFNAYEMRVLQSFVFRFKSFRKGGLHISTI